MSVTGRLRARYLRACSSIACVPAIPNEEAGGTAIWLPDRQLVRWQPSDPIGYANWFRDRMSAEYKTLREHLASRGRPAWLNQPNLRKGTERGNQGFPLLNWPPARSTYAG
jgi:hypothetical protein